MPSDRRTPSRGCLHKLVVQNFKSYAGSLTLGPFKDFTCVIGPNGSGKSNLMDAVSFVVGVNTAQLRGNKLADFRTNLETATDAPTSVTLYYHGPRQAGEKSAPETLFTRTITNRDANEWRIDGRKVDADEYQKRLKSVGLLVKPRNFLVFQNEVEAIAQKSPKQLTELLERISGSEDLKQEYEELQEKKGEAAQAAVAVYKRSLVVSNERKLLKEQVKEAMNYQDLQDKLLDLKIRRFLFDLFHIEKQLATFADEAESHAMKLKECEADCKAVNKAYDKKAKQKAEKEKEWAAVDKKVQEQDKIIKRIKTREILQIEEYLEGKKRQVSSLEKDIANIKEKIKDTKASLKPQEKQHKELSEELAQEQQKQKNKDFDASAQQVKKYNELKQRCMALTVKAKGVLERTMRENKNDEIEFEQKNTKLQDLQNRVDVLNGKIKESHAAKGDIDKGHSELSEQEHKVKSDLTDVEKSLKEQGARQKVLLENETEMTSQMTDARVDERHAKSEEDKKKVVDYLCQSFPGVRGRVMDLCKVKQRTHELAITVVMESNMDAIVVEREETAKRCVEYLREQRKKPMTFLPLDSIKASQPDERLRMISGAKLALDLIDFDKRDEKVMWFVTGNAVVVSTLDDAKRLAFGSSAPKCKIVTLDASIISKSGAMTGGDTSHLTNKAQRWQRQEFDKLKEKAEALSKELTSVRHKIELDSRKKASLERESQRLAHLLQLSKKKKSDTDQGLSNFKKEAEQYTKSIAALSDEILVVKAKMDKRAGQIEKEKAEVDAIEHEVFKDFCKELHIQSIQEFEGVSLAEHKARTERVIKLSGQVGKTSMVIEKLKDTLKAAESQESSKRDEIEKLNDEIEGHKADKQKKETEIKKAEEEKSQEEKKNKANKKEIDEIDKELREIQLVQKKTVDGKEEVLRLLERAESKMEGLRSQRKNIVEQCSLDEIPLPKKDRGHGQGGDEDRDDMEVDGGSCSHSQSAKTTKEEIANDRFDYSKLPREQRRDLSDKEQSKVRDKLEEEQLKLTETLNSLNPNMKAMDQLKEVEVRYQAVLEETKAAKENSQALAQKFEETKQTRSDLFNGCFDHVKGCIDSIYKELTSEPSKIEHSVGGSAYLTLNNQEEPYLDGIKYDTIPPGKRFMDMAHLSGGEKTVAALALLFAINSFAPAPFIVLDEVDAALDARNVAKVTRYIQSRRKEQQCVIISLKERFYEKADALVGICRDISGGQSKVFTLDLTAYAP